MTTAADEGGPRAPSLLDAALPVVVLIGLIALTIWLFGVSATDGPLQVALLLSAAFASLMALKNGYKSAAIADAAIGGVASAMSAIFILLAVGALLGTWNMAGTIPTVVDYGVRDDARARRRKGWGLGTDRVALDRMGWPGASARKLARVAVAVGVAVVPHLREAPDG